MHVHGKHKIKRYVSQMFTKYIGKIMIFPHLERINVIKYKGIYCSDYLFHDRIRGALALLINSALEGCPDTPDFDFFAYNAEISTPAALRLGCAVKLCGRINEELATSGGPIILGARMVSEAFETGGHVNFRLSHEFFYALIDLVNSSSPLPSLTGDIAECEGYALARMLMLNKCLGKNGGVPAPALRALWIAFAACDPTLDHRQRTAAVARASTALTGITAHIDPKSRRLLLSGAGDMAACAARLLACAMDQCAGR